MPQSKLSQGHERLNANDVLNESAIFAKEVKEKIKNIESKEVLEKGKNMFTKSYEYLVKQFKEGGLLKKSLMVGAGIIAGSYIVDFFKDSFKSVSSVRDWFFEKSESVTQDTEKNSVASIIKGIGLFTGAGLSIKALSDSLTSSMSFSEITSLLNSEDPMTEIWKKVKDGSLDLADDAAAYIKNSLGIKEGAEMSDKLSNNVDSAKNNSSNEKLDSFKFRIAKEQLLALTKKPTELVEKLYNGDLSLNILDGDIVLELASLSFPGLTASIAVEEFKLLYPAIIEANETGNYIPMAVTSMGAVFFGKAAVNSIRSHHAIISSGEHLPAKFWRGLKSITPLTKEWRYVMKSIPYAIPGVETFYHAMNSHKIAEAKKITEGLESMLASKTVDWSKFKKNANDLLRDFDFGDDLVKIKKNLPNSTVNFLEYQYHKHFAEIRPIIEELKLGNLKSKSELVENLSKVNKSLDSYKTFSSDLIRRGKYLLSGDLKSVVSMSNAERLKVKSEMQKRSLVIDESFRNPSKSLESIQNEMKDLDPKSKKYINLQKKELALKVASDHRVFTKSFKPLELSTNVDDNIGKILNRSSEIEAMAKGIDESIKLEVQEILEKHAANPDILKEKLSSVDLKIQEATKQKITYLNDLNEAYSKIPKSERTAALKAQVKLAYEGSDSLMTRLKRGAKGRLKMAGFMALGIAGVEYAMSDKEQLEQILLDLGPQAAQLFVELTPGIGTIEMFKSAITGEETMTDRDLDVTGRLTNLAFGAVSFATDALTVLSIEFGGTPGLAAKLAVIAARGGKKAAVAEKLLAKLPTIMKIGSNMGFPTLLKSVKNFDFSKKAASTLRTTQKIGNVAAYSLIGSSVLPLAYSYLSEDVNVPNDINIKIND